MRQFITSMSRDGYDQYGQQFLERAKACLPGDLAVYTEDASLLDVAGVEWRDLNEVEGFGWFRDGLGRFPVANGFISGSFNYRFNVNKFCAKVFSQVHAATLCRSELWWIDADVEFHNPIPASFFDNALDGVFMAYLGRPGWHSCLSLAGFNNQHSDAARFWANYGLLFVTGQVLLLPEWHDSYVVDFLRDTLSLQSRNMAAGLALPDGPCNVFDDVLKGFANHNKGNLKKTGGPVRYRQLIDIARQKRPRRVLEIGTWNGRRAIDINSAVPGGIEYVGFDLFEFANDKTDAEEKNVKPHHGVNGVLQRLMAGGVNVEGLHVGNTRDSLPKYVETNPEKFDLIFIDGGHSVETIASDLDACLQLIAPGGVMVLDDWYEGGDIDTNLWGCNRAVKALGLDFELLMIADPVRGGGTTQMVRIDFPC